MQSMHCDFAHDITEAIDARYRYFILTGTQFDVPLCVDWPCMQCECHHYNYAQAMCVQYSTRFTCQYSQKCRFAHTFDEQQRGGDDWVNIGGPSRLPVFNNLRRHHIRVPA